MAGRQNWRVGVQGNLRSAVEGLSETNAAKSFNSQAVKDRADMIMMKRSSMVAVCSLLAAAMALGQSGPPTKPDAAAKPPAYDVVSVKPDKGNGPYSSWWRTNADGFSANVPVRSLIMSAYGVFMVEQISGLPGWGETEQFDVEAKMDSDTLAAYGKLSKEERDKQVKAMLQALLAERFSLKIRREAKQLPVYALVIAKGGPKLKESTADAQTGYTVSGSSLKGEGIEIGTMAISLENNVGRLIVDKTGLTGKYAIDLKWSMEESPSSSDQGPSIFTALQDQLGLKLESTKAPVDTIVIEHLDKPSEN